jgi:hypothetical protein
MAAKHIRGRRPKATTLLPSRTSLLAANTVPLQCLRKSVTRVSSAAHGIYSFPRIPMRAPIPT